MFVIVIDSPARSYVTRCPAVRGLEYVSEPQHAMKFSTREEAARYLECRASSLQHQIVELQ